MPKILLLQPTQYCSGGGLCQQRHIYLPGLAFPLLAALTPEDWEVEICLEVVDAVDFDSDADIIAIGSMGHAAFRGLDIAKEFKQRGKTVIMGGYMASMVAEAALEVVDSVIVGDAELSYPKLLKDYAAGQPLQRIYDMPVKDLNSQPLPRYDLLTRKPIGDMLPVMAGRGCPHLCSFCSIACVYRGRYLTRSLDEVMRDIHEVRRLGYKRFYLIDDNIVGNPKFFSALCDAIEPLGMRWASQCSLHLAKRPELLAKAARSGCEIMSFGLESISQEGLDKVHKTWVKADEHETLLARIAKAGIVPSTEMMIGLDGDTEDSIRQTFDFVQRARIPIPRFYILTPMPGTDLYKQYKDEGRLLHENWREYTGTRCVHQPEKISAEKVTELYWWLNRQVFSWPSIIHRVLKNPLLWRKPRMLIFSLVVNLHYRRYVMKGVTPNIF